MRLNNNQKISREQLEQVLAAYQRDPEESRALCITLGLSPRYGHQMASRYGMAKRKQYRALTSAEKETMRATKRADDSADPRWQWAIDRGSVTAP